MFGDFCRPYVEIINKVFWNHWESILEAITVVERKVLSWSGTRMVTDKIALFIFSFKSSISDSWHAVNVDFLFFFLQGIINEDWCFSLYTARNSVQVGKIIACINKKPSILLFLNLVVAFINSCLDPYLEQHRYEWVLQSYWRGLLCTSVYIHKH